MFSGSRSIVALLGIVLCFLFSCAVFVGGWLAFGLAALLALFCVVVSVSLLARIEQRQLAVLKELEDGVGAEFSACEGIGTAMVRLSNAVTILSEEHSFFRRALQALGNPAFLTDADGRIVVATQSALELLHKSGDEVVGTSISQALYSKEGIAFPEMGGTVNRSVADVVELTLWDGRVVSVRLFSNPIGGHGEESLGVVYSLVDMSEDVGKQKEIENRNKDILDLGKHLSSLAEHVASATELLSASADDQAQGARQQRSQTTSVATSMEEMAATVLEVARNAAATSDAASKANDSAIEGVDMVSRAVEAIDEVAESAEQLGREIGLLDAQAEEIGRIINVINDIADQTNLLALNAAIEAARAGEAGRGFAVVADEVRKLAEKTVTATKEVEEAISTIQQRSGLAIKSMRQTEAQVVVSTDLSNQAGQSLQQITASVNDMVGRVALIATAAEEQSTAAEDINRSIDEIALIAGDADEAAGQAASATRDLAGLAQELLDVSRKFMGDEEEIRLRESAGQMKGILPKLAQEFVQREYGEDVLKSMRDAMGNPVFLSTDTYSDQVLGQMAELVGGVTGEGSREFFLALGKYTVAEFHKLYPGYFKDESLKEFYLRMNDVHALLTKDYPGIKPPSFTYEDKGEALFMNYRSSRGLFDYFEGILLGAADFKGERVTVEVKPFDDTTARAEIVFHAKR